MTAEELAAIVARDSEWIEQDGRLVYTWINARSGEPRVAEHATDPDGPADRRALLGLLGEMREALAIQPEELPEPIGPVRRKWWRLGWLSAQAVARADLGKQPDDLTRAGT